MTTPTTAELAAQLVALQAQLEGTWKPTVYRDIWADDLRLLVNGVDHTYFRGKPTQFSGYELQEPYAFGPADFVFPGISQLEVHRFGHPGETDWVDPERTRMELVPVRTVDGVTVYDRDNRVWAGIMTRINPARGSDGDELHVHCDGDVSGRLALRERQPRVNTRTADIGIIVHDMLLHCGIHMLPYLGPKTGIPRTNVGGGTNFLSFTDEVLAGALTINGGQWTIGRDPNKPRRYRMQLKDRTTVHATVFLGAPGIVLDPVRDISEEPTTLYGSCTEPNGRKVINAVAPNLIGGEAATYPFADNRTFGEGTTDADTDTGAGVYAMHRKLIGQGLMSRAEGTDDVYDDETTDAVRALQRRVGLPRTGDMNPATWRRLFDVTETGRTLYGARVLPWAQISEVQRFFLTSNGSVDTANPDYDPRRLVVDHTIDGGGSVWKRDMQKFMDRHLDRIHSGKNWVASMELSAGVGLFAGDVDADTPEADLLPISALEAREGWNIKVCYFDGDTLFHVGGISVSADRDVRFDLDTRARDLLTIGQIKARHIESRNNPSRDFIRSVRRPNALSTVPVWSEIGGILEADEHLKGGQWNKVPIPVGQAGSIERVHVRLRNERAKFVMAITDSNPSVKEWTQDAGADPLQYVPPPVPDDDPETPTPDPDPGSKWAKPHVQALLKRKHLTLYTAGQGSQPLGYWPRQHRRDNGHVTDAPITGDWDYIAGIPFRTLGHGVVYLWIFSDRDCALQGGQILYPNQGEGY